MTWMHEILGSTTIAEYGGHLLRYSRLVASECKSCGVEFPLDGHFPARPLTTAESLTVVARHLGFQGDLEIAQWLTTLAGDLEAGLKLIGEQA